MEDHIYKIIELTGTSGIGIEDAVQNAIQRASKTLQNIRWFEVTEVRGAAGHGKIERWQVTVKVGFTMKD